MQYVTFCECCAFFLYTLMFRFLLLSTVFGLCSPYQVNRHGDTVQIDWYWGTRLAERNVTARWDVGLEACQKRPLPFYLSSSNPHESAYSRILGARLNSTVSKDAAWVLRPSDACICVVNDADESWRGLCRNVALLSPNWWPGDNHMDRPGVSKAQNLQTVFGTDAALVMAAHVREEFVVGFDVMLPRLREDFFTPDGLWRKSHEKHSHRSTLAYFSGTYETGWPMPWYDQRIALQTLHDPTRGVVINLKPHGAPVDDGWKKQFDHMLRSSQFGFVVGGGGIDTFRFLEVLSSGAIPVVFDDLILPFEYSLIENWEDCVVRVPFSALANIIQTLEDMSSGGRLRRRMVCASIFRAHFSSVRALRESVVTSLVNGVLHV